MSTKRVLIVDDDEEFAETILGFELEEMGCAVQIASDLQSARKELKEHAFSLVTVDMCLEEESEETLEGEFLLEYIRERFGHIPCLIISGSPCPPDLIFSMSRRYPMIPDGGYLNKRGFNLRRFKDLVARILSAQEDLSTSSGALEDAGARAGGTPSVGRTHRHKLLVGLRRILAVRFDESDLGDLCFDLGVDYESLPGDGKASKVRALLRYVDHRDQIPELVRIGSALRPDISWDDFG